MRYLKPVIFTIFTLVLVWGFASGNSYAFYEGNTDFLVDGDYPGLWSYPETAKAIAVQEKATPRHEKYSYMFEPTNFAVDGDYPGNWTEPRRFEIQRVIHVRRVNYALPKIQQTDFLVEGDYPGQWTYAEMKPETVPVRPAIMFPEEKSIYCASDEFMVENKSREAAELKLVMGENEFEEAIQAGGRAAYNLMDDPAGMEEALIVNSGNREISVDCK